MISAIIPVYNSEKTINFAIKGVLSQKKYNEVEVIVVDDGSTDMTAEKVRSFPNVRYFYQKNAGPASARNRGAREAKGDILFFTDSDCIPPPDWIEKAIVHFNRVEVGVVSGTYDLIEGSNLLAKCIHMEIMHRHQERMPVYPKSFGSYNFCIRKKIFQEVGGFNEQYGSASGEDNDLSYKILKAGYKIYFEKGSRVKHHHTAQIGKYLREQFNHGFWRVRMYLDHPDMMKGDDYTFWKDIVEPPLVIGLIVMGSLIFFYQSAVMIFFILIFSLFFIEIFFGYLCVKNFSAGLFWAFAMLLRAFARTFGFVYGFSYFSAKKSNKPFKTLVLMII